MTTSHIEANPTIGLAGKTTPVFYRIAIYALLLGILAQFALAGFAISVDSSFVSAHKGLGGLLALAAGIVALTPWLKRTVRPLRWWGSLVGILYLGQILLVILGRSPGTSGMMALHPLNGAMILLATLVLVAKIEGGRQKQDRMIPPRD